MQGKRRQFADDSDFLPSRAAIALYFAIRVLHQVIHTTSYLFRLGAMCGSLGSIGKT